MCGICGIFNTSSRVPINEEDLDRMLQSIKHRGPDDQGIYVESGIGLGSTRLSIIDLAGGKQPICNEDRSLWIVFNGEIYNYRELTAFLKKKGHQFSTNSDTEVILHLYEEFGIDSVQHLNGMFAFAIWDSRKEQVVIARDRMGIKPLYYTEANGQLLFGSEMKVLLTNPQLKRQIDPISLNEYLSFEYVPAPRTILSGVSRLEPGHLLVYSRNGSQNIRYYRLSLERSESQAPVDWRDYTALLDQKLREAVHRELVSDVPVGVLLSGGVDSSLVASYMTELYPGKVKSFSIAFEEKSFDESRFARMVSKHLGTDHNELMLSGKTVAQMVPSIPDFLDEPFGDSSYIPTFLLSKFARQQVKVVLGGDGGDEMFAGYPTLVAHKLINVYERVVPWTIRASFSPLLLQMLPVSFNNISLDFRVRRILAGRGQPLEARHGRWLGSFYDEDKQLLFQDWIKPVLRDTYHQAYQHAQECDATSYLNRLLYNDIKLYLDGDILFKVDRASMANSLEVRVPLLNRDLVDFVSTLPANLKLRGLKSKFLFKKCAEPRLPSEVVNRPKKGFNMPVATWLTTDLREIVTDSLSEETIRKQDLFRYPYIKSLLDDHFTHRHDNRKLLWTLLVFQLWYAKYIAE